MHKDFILIGIDGGATKASAWEIIYNSQHKTFSLGKINASRLYRDFDGYITDFKPVDLKTQLNERENGIHITPEEKQQAQIYIKACAAVVMDIVKQKEKSKVLIGIGMPGLKTSDKRGISVVANGPRMIHFSDVLEKILEENKVKLVSPINHIGSDADYCGIGENYSSAGLFRNTNNAYYLGGGTGVADAMKLNGKLLPFDEAKAWIAKTWEMKSEEGISLELVTSVSGIQKTYAQIAGKTVEKLNQVNIYPLQIAEMAFNGDTMAQKTYQIVNKNLALLLYERIITLNKGWQNLLGFVNPDKPKLTSEHPFLNNVFEKIIIGQRLGELFDDQFGAEIVKKPVLSLVSKMIQSSGFLTETNKAHYTDLENIVMTSRLREAPALGAGIDAFLNLN